MFPWSRNSRRRRWISEPWPAEWDAILRGAADFQERLSSAEKAQWQDIVKVLVAEKNWEGCGGLEMSAEIKVIIAAQAARLTIALPEKFFDRVQSILVYPETYVAPMHTPIGSGLALESEAELEGQAWLRGPVILSWADVLNAAEGLAPGENVVLHEFAHQLDMRNGAADGVPDFTSADAADRWEQILSQQFDAFCAAYRRGGHTVVSNDATHDHAEFFAYSTEAFFESPLELRNQMPEWYEALKEFYRQDPAARP